MSFSFVYRVFFLDVCGVEEYDLCEFRAGGGAVYLCFESVLNEFGQESAVVEVCVGQQYRVDGGGVYGEWFVVSLSQVSFLVESAVDENFQSVGL